MRREVLVELACSFRRSPKVAPGCGSGGKQSRCRLADCMKMASLMAGDGQHLSDDRDGNPAGVLGDQIALGAALQAAKQFVGDFVNTSAKSIDRPWRERPRDQTT